MIVFSLYMLFTVSYFLHLPSRVPALGALRLEFLLGLALFISVTMSGSLNRTWAVRSPVFRRLAWLIGYIVLSIPLVTWPGSVIRFNLPNYTKVVFFFLITAAIVDSEKRLKLFILVFVGCQFFRVLEPLYLHLTAGYWGDLAFSHTGGETTILNRLAGAPHDIVNSNQLAWVIVSTVPFIYYLGLNSKKVLLAGLSILVLGTMGYALTLTGSRSGMVCLAVVILGIGWLGPKRGRRLTLLSILLVPIVIFALGAMDTDLLTRYRSLFDHSVTGGDTAAGRLNGVFKNLRTISGNPIFGHGVGTSREINYNLLGGSGQVTHNLYVEALQETGAVGLILLLMYLQSFGRTLLETYKVAKDACSPFLTHLVQAIFVWFIMNIIYSLSCFGLSSWEWYLFGGITHVCWVFVRTGIDSEKVKTDA